MAVEQSQNNLKKAHEVELQKIKNKLARASWKYHFYIQTEVEDYTDYLIDQNPTKLNLVRKTTLTKLNFFKIGYIYSGKYTVEKKFSKLHIGFKLGEFTKNRKPFFFRSKKKK